MDVIKVLAAENDTLRRIVRELGEALETCRPWIDDFQQGDEALDLYRTFRSMEEMRELLFGEASPAEGD